MHHFLAAVFIITWASQREPKVKSALCYFLFAFFHSQIAVWALYRMRTFLLSLCMCMIREQAQTHMIKKMVDISQASSLKGSTNSMISSPLKPHTNARTVCSRPHTECFWVFYERVALRTLWEINLWANICEHAISNELSNVYHVKKHLHKHYHVFTHGREPSRIPNELWNFWGTRSNLHQNIQCLVGCAIPEL